MNKERENYKVLEWYSDLIGMDLEKINEEQADKICGGRGPFGFATSGIPMDTLIVELKSIQRQSEIIFDHLRSAGHQGFSVEWERARTIEFSSATGEAKARSEMGNSCLVLFKHGDINENFEVIVDPIMDHLLMALESATLEMFKRCEECNTLFFHWRKRERKYCSKSCQSKAAVYRHRAKREGKA